MPESAGWRRALSPRLFLVLAVLVVVVGSVMVGGPWLVGRLAVGWINEHFPARSTDEERTAAIAASWQGLERMAAANAAFRISSGTLGTLVRESVMAATAATAVKLDGLVVHTEAQRIRFSARFEADLPAQDVVTAGTAEGAVAISGTERGVVLTPGLDRMHLEMLRVSGIRLPGPLTKSVGDALNTFVANINGAIQPIAVDTAAPLLEAHSVTLGDKVIAIPAQSVVAASVLADRDALVWLGQIGGAPLGAPTGDAGTEFVGFKAAFQEKAKALLVLLPEDGMALDGAYVERLLGMSGTLPPPGARASASLEAAWHALRGLSGPDLAVAVPAGDLKRLVEPTLREGLAGMAAKAGITLEGADLTLNYGRISIAATASAPLSEPVGGRVRFRAVIAAAPVVEGAAVQILPTLDEVSILGVEGGSLAPPGLLPALNALLGGVAAGISQAMPAIPLAIQPFAVPEINLAAVAAGVPGLELAPSAVPATHGRVARVAVLLAPSGIMILADVDIDSPHLVPRPAGMTPAPYPQQAEQVEAAFRKVRAESLGPDAADRVLGTVAWRRVAELVNAWWRGTGGIRALYRFDTGTQVMEGVPIELVEKPAYKCAMGRPCDFTSCADGCTRDRCDWHCGACTHVPCPTWQEPLRTCLKCTPDPVCEATKVACQGAREPKYQACRTNCDIKANADKAVCDAQANLEKAGCDLGKAIQDAASHVGGIGRIGGEARVRGAASTDAGTLVLTMDRPGVRFTPKIEAAVTLDGALEFTPYDIGHVLVCPVKGKAPFTTTVTLPQQQPVIAGALRAVPESDGDGEPKTLDLHLSVAPFALKATATPAPAEALLTQNPHLLVVCNPVLGEVVSGLTIIGKAQGLTGQDLIRAVAGTKVSAVFSGNIEYEMEGFVVPLAVAEMEVVIGGQVLALRPSLSETTIDFRAEP